MARSLKNMMGAGIGALTGRMINGIAFDGLIATGTGQSDALQLTGDVNVVSIVNSNAGVVLPPVPQPADEIMVTNLGTNALNIYPSPGSAIHNGGMNVPFSLPSGASASFIARPGSVNWVVLSSSGSVSVGTVAPVLSSPTATATSSTTASLGVTTDTGNGTLYWVVSTSSTPPSTAQVAAGQDSTGSTAAAHGSQSVSAAGVLSASATGLTASTTYYAYFLHTNVSSQQSNVAAAASFATSSSGTLAAPTIGYPSPLASNPATIPVHVPVDWQSGDALKLARSSSVAMTSPTILTHTLIDADIGGTVSIGLSGVTLSGITYFQAYGSHSSLDSANLSNIVTWGDTTAPVITTSATQSITETTPLAVALTGTDTGGIASWSIVGGADQLQFQIVGSTLEWFANGYQNYATPLNFPPNNASPYNVTVQATDYGGNTSTLAMAVTVTQIDQTPDAFTFTAVNNATLSTVYTSNTVTLSGLQVGFNIPASLSGTGFTYSKNGGAYQAPGSFTVQNGDTITLKATSAASNNITESASVTVGTYSTGWSVATPGSAANLTSTTGTSKNTSVAVASPFFQWIESTNSSGPPRLVRSTIAATNTKHHLEWKINGFFTTASLYLGYDDGTTDFTSSLGDSTLPGAASGGNGITFSLEFGGLYVKANGVQTPIGGSVASGDSIIFETDTGAKTVTIYKNSSSTVLWTGTLTSKIPTSWYAFGGGVQGDGTLTAGHSDAATFVPDPASGVMTPSTGYNFYYA